MDEVLRLDMKEYRLLCEAQRLKNIDQEYWLHVQAYANMKATLRDKKGKLIYHDFKKLYDYDKALGKRVHKKESPQIRAMRSYLRRKKKEEKVSE